MAEHFRSHYTKQPGRVESPTEQQLRDTFLKNPNRAISNEVHSGGQTDEESEGKKAKKRKRTAKKKGRQVNAAYLDIQIETAVLIVPGCLKGQCRG